MYDRVWNRKKCFETAAFLDFKLGLGTSGVKIKTKTNPSQLLQIVTLLWIFWLDIPCSIDRKAGISK